MNKRGGRKKMGENAREMPVVKINAPLELGDVIEDAFGDRYVLTIDDKAQHVWPTDEGIDRALGEDRCCPVCGYDGLWYEPKEIHRQKVRQLFTDIMWGDKDGRGDDK